MNIVMPRRAFLAGLAATFAAPAIVRAESLMPLKTRRVVTPRFTGIGLAIYNAQGEVVWSSLPPTDGMPEYVPPIAAGGRVQLEARSPIPGEAWCLVRMGHLG